MQAGSVTHRVSDLETFWGGAGHKLGVPWSQPDLERAPALCPSLLSATVLLCLQAASSEPFFCFSVSGSQEGGRGWCGDVCTGCGVPDFL